MKQSDVTWADAAIRALWKGERFKLRVTGKSMEPILMSGQEFTLAPLKEINGQLDCCDVVLVIVAGTPYLHRVGAICYAGRNSKRAYYRIENAAGKVNGWVPVESIHGVLMSATG